MLQRRQCANVVSKLERKGLVVRRPHFHAVWGQTQNKYDVVIPASTPDDATPPEMDGTSPCVPAHPPLAAEHMGGGNEAQPADVPRRRGPLRQIAAKPLTERLKEREGEREEEPAAVPPRPPTIRRPLSHAQRNRFRHEYDDILKTKARSYDPWNEQRGRRLAQDDLGAFDQWLARKQGLRP
jgi:hypothetical protein